MFRILLFIGIIGLLSIWLSPFFQTVLQAKGSFIYFITSNGIPIGQLGFTAIFTSFGLIVIFSILQLFK